MTTIGYIVPEFPGQTHIFFWREIACLEKLGVKVDIVSTRPPPSEIRSHTWSDNAEKRTTYLQVGSSVSIGIGIIEALTRSNPAMLFECLRSIWRAKVSFSDRVRLIAMAGFGARLGRIASCRHWDHMHVHSCGNAANITAFASILSGIAYSLTLHGPLSDYGSNQPEKWRNAKVGITITQKLRAEIEAILGGDIAAKTQIAPMGVNLERFKRLEPYREWNGAEPVRLYSVGRLNPCKDHETLIRAVGILKDRGFDICLTIAGEDELGGRGHGNYLRTLVVELDLSENVRLPGALPEDAIREGLLNSHLFALASLHEPLGVAIMEAMALQVPVVATNAGGVPELIEHGRDGYLVDVQDPQALASAIETILLDAKLAKRLAGASREKIRNKFQDTRSAELLARIAGRQQKNIIFEG